MPPSLSDAQVMLHEVARFARERVAPAAARPEAPMDDATLVALSREATELGILPSADDGEALGLWGEPGQDASVAFTVGALQSVARVNTGLAFAWHRAALARWISAECGLTDLPRCAHELAFTPTGHYGLARGAAARWLRAADLDDDDTRLIVDWLDHREHATTVIAPHGWCALLWPVWHAGRVQWQLVHRDALDVLPCRPQHGLDELAAFRVSAIDAPSSVSSLDGPVARTIFGQALALDWLGLLAIALGALERGQALATSFAAIRHQGGKIIADHSAVQRMLSDIEVARQQAQATLAMFTRAINESDAALLAAARAAAHPLLRDAANQVVQLHGGIGYMRDAGPEKIVRDQDMLSLQGGGVLAAHTFVAAWMGAAS